MQDMKMLYRLLVLYMLQEKADGISNTKIAMFVLEKEYTTYFVIQEVIADLLSADLIRAEKTRQNTIYTITADGIRTLAALSDKLSDSVREDVDAFLSDSQAGATEEPFATAVYEKLGDGTYEVTCQLRTRSRTFIRLVLTAEHEEQAIVMAQNWKEQHMNLYTDIMAALLS